MKVVDLIHILEDMPLDAEVLVQHEVYDRGTWSTEAYDIDTVEAPDENHSFVLIL